jgi:hypothetical protein
MVAFYLPFELSCKSPRALLCGAFTVCFWCTVTGRCTGVLNSFGRSVGL